MATRPDLRERAERRARILAEALTAGRAALRRQAARHTPRTAEVEDVLQDACLEFLRYYEGPPGTPALRYLMLAVKHRAWAIGTSAWSRHSSEVELRGTDSLLAGKPQIAALCERPGPAETAERRERLYAAAAFLAQLKPDQRTAVLLHALGYTYREIAALRGWTYTKVNRCLAEGRAALRRLAEGGEIEPPNP